MGSQLDEIIKRVNKKADADIFGKGLKEYSYERIPFTSPRMNYMTHGGLVVGRLIEFYGEEGGGKTTTALDIVANFQNMFPDREVLYVDVENTLDAVWAQKLGVDVDNIYLYQPESQSAEEIFDFVRECVKSGEVGLWVIDSLAAMLSQQEWEKDIGEATYAGISKSLTRFSKEIELLNKQHRCTGIGINQNRDKVGSMYGGTTTPGGHAWKYFCSSRIEFRKGSYFDEKGNNLTRGADTPAGNYVLAHIEKIKTGAPNRKEGQYRIRYDIGIDYLADLVDIAILYNIIDQSGAWFTILDPESGEIIKDKLQGKAKVFDLLDQDPEIAERVEELVNKALNI